MLLHDGKSFLEVKNTTNSFTYEVQCIEITFDCTWKMTKIYFGSDRLCFLIVSKTTVVTYVIECWQIIFRSQKYRKLIYLWGSMPLKLCLVVHETWHKICFGSDRWCFLCVSKKTIVTVTFNMLLHAGKLFFRSPKYHKFIYLRGSMPLKLCLLVHGKWLKIYFGSNRWCFHCVSIETIVTITFNMLLHDGKSLFRSQKYHKLINLWGSMAMKLCLILHEKLL